MEDPAGGELAAWVQECRAAGFRKGPPRLHGPLGEGRGTSARLRSSNLPPLRLPHRLQLDSRAPPGMARRSCARRRPMPSERRASATATDRRRMSVAYLSYPATPTIAPSGVAETDRPPAPPVCDVGSTANRVRSQLLRRSLRQQGAHGPTGQRGRESKLPARRDPPRRNGRARPDSSTGGSPLTLGFTGLQLSGFDGIGPKGCGALHSTNVPGIALASSICALSQDRRDRV